MERPASKNGNLNNHPGILLENLFVITDFVIWTNEKYSAGSWQ